jgi:hypothetical protein
MEVIRNVDAATRSCSFIPDQPAGAGRGAFGSRSWAQELTMGVSSTAIFGDDSACDVRDAYRELVANGLSGPEATDQLLREWGDIIDDEDGSRR